MILFGYILGLFDVKPCLVSSPDICCFESWIELNKVILGLENRDRTYKLFYFTEYYDKHNTLFYYTSRSSLNIFLWQSKYNPRSTGLVNDWWLMQLIVIAWVREFWLSCQEKSQTRDLNDLILQKRMIFYFD